MASKHTMTDMKMAKDTQLLTHIGCKENMAHFVLGADAYRILSMTIAQSVEQEWMVTVMRLIDADAYIEEYKEDYFYSDQYETEWFWNGIINAPTVDAEVVRHSEWIEHITTMGNFKIVVNTCSNCGHESLETYNYCPNCGARMDGDLDAIG